jgi:hypothetical protein
MFPNTFPKKKKKKRSTHLIILHNVTGLPEIRHSHDDNNEDATPCRLVHIRRFAVK